MPVVFRETKLTKPKIQHVRLDAYLNGRPLWIQPSSTTKQGSEPQYQTKPIFDPTLTATASTTYSGTAPKNIIDEDLTTYWMSSGAVYEPNNQFQWIYVTLLKPAVAVAYTLTCNWASDTYVPKSWRIHGSNNAVTWTTLHEVKGQVQAKRAQLSASEMGAVVAQKVVIF
jgi:hypothetical protein